MSDYPQSKKWFIRDEVPANYLRQFKDVHPLVVQVLYNRGVLDPKDAHKFLYVRGTRDDLSDPRLMPDMDRAIERIRHAIKREQKIVVYGDFDADGVTSTTLMVEALTAFGAKNVKPYIPIRAEEGYGLNTPALEELAKDGTDLVITVDCGIRSVQEVEDGKKLGLDIIITDHHSLGEELPDAYAVINCKREGYPEPMLAGVGVAFQLVHALHNIALKNNGKAYRRNPIELESLLDLVAIGTVADLMPLNSIENRILVRRGLEVIRRAKRPGIRALLNVIGVEPEKVTAGTIGFGIGPRINAAGRLDDAMIAVNLLSAKTMQEAENYALQLQELNLKRQDITRDAQDKIRGQLDDAGKLPLIFASDRTFEPGIVGLIAGRLCEEFYRPAIVMEEGEDESRASCRSIPEFDITAALDQCADLLVRHGGHALAAGFTVINENIPVLLERLNAMAKEAISGKDLIPTLDIDKVLDIHQLSETLVNELDQLEPTGNGNRLPIFAVERVRILESRTVGRDDRHLKLKIARAGQPPLDGIGFGLGEWAGAINGDCVDLAFQLEINEWNGRTNLQLNVQDIRPSED